jgi:Zn-finger domain-containing protein
MIYLSDMEEQELINIGIFCNNVLIKHGENVSHCNAIYIKEDNVIEFRLRYRISKKETYNTYQYIIENYNFIITDTEVKVNKSTIDLINNGIEERLKKQYANI